MPQSTHFTSAPQYPQLTELKELRALNQLKQAIMEAMLKRTQMSWAEVICMAAFFGVLSFLHSARQICPGA